MCREGGGASLRWSDAAGRRGVGGREIELAAGDDQRQTPRNGDEVVRPVRRRLRRAGAASDDPQTHFVVHPRG